jgi:hypothetical protein
MAPGAAFGEQPPALILTVNAQKLTRHRRRLYRFSNAASIGRHSRAFGGGVVGDVVLDSRRDLPPRPR